MITYFTLTTLIYYTYTEENMITTLLLQFTRLLLK